MAPLVELLRDPGIQKLLFALVGGAIAFAASFGLDWIRSRRENKSLRSALRADLEVLQEALQGLRAGEPVGSTNAMLQLERVCSLYGEDLNVLKATRSEGALRALCRVFPEARTLLKGLRIRETNHAFDPGSPSVLIRLVEDVLRQLQ